MIIRKEDYNEKKYNKWELIKEDEAKLDTFKDNTGVYMNNKLKIFTLYNS